MVGAAETVGAVLQGDQRMLSKVLSMCNFSTGEWVGVRRLGCVAVANGAVEGICDCSGPKVVGAEPSV